MLSILVRLKEGITLTTDQVSWKEVVILLALLVFLAVLILRLEHP
jgi:hypothetical protein